MNRKPANGALHQFLTGATTGDAITDQALLLRGWLRGLGFESHLYAQHIHASMAEEVRPLTTYRPARDGRRVIYHHSIGSDVADFLRQNQLEIVLINHNVTPPEFFERINPAWVQLAQLGQAQLRACARTPFWRWPIQPITSWNFMKPATSARAFCQFRWRKRS
ncbi:MAG: hypothetical protein IPF56_05405 [Chloroflexi bacterium]|nr:hypothetical protein [Chloroflexota bacterium]